MWAALHGHLEVVKLLLQHGADLNKKNIDGKTALDIAKLQKHISVINYLSGLL